MFFHTILSTINISKLDLRVFNIIFFIFLSESAFIRMARTRTAPTSSKTLTSKVQKRPRPNQNQPKYRNFIKAVLKDEYELLSISKSSVEVLNHLFIELVDKFSNEMMKLAKKQGRTQVNKNDAVAAVKLLMGNEGGDAKAIENEIRKKLRENNY